VELNRKEVRAEQKLTHWGLSNKMYKESWKGKEGRPAPHTLVSKEREKNEKNEETTKQ
jgi:hypothetical protein